MLRTSNVNKSQCLQVSATCAAFSISTKEKKNFDMQKSVGF